MSDLLSIAASGLRAYQTALTTTSENIANAGTAGYVRRTSNIREVATTNQTTGLNGMGVVTDGISRQVDVYRAGQVRVASSDLARSEASATWLDRIQGALSGNKLGNAITSFYTSARTAAADPSALAARQTMLEAASSASAAFKATGVALDGAMRDLDATTDATIGQFNGLTSTLAKINFGLGHVTPGTSSAAALLDQRDQMLETMSTLSDIHVDLDGAGRATVRAGSGSGVLLVQGVEAATLSAARNDEGTLSYSARFGGDSHSLASSGGIMAGLVEGARSIADARDALNTLAADFAGGVNAVQAAGDDLNGKPGDAIFTVGDPASELSVAMRDPRGIAAAGRGKGARDNSNLLALDALRSEGGPEQTLATLETANGAALNARKSVVEAQTAIRDNAVSARDSVTGVNVDEEAVDLMRFQQAYQASARVIQVAREALQSVLDIR